MELSKKQKINILVIVTILLFICIIFRYDRIFTGVYNREKVVVNFDRWKSQSIDCSSWQSGKSYYCKVKKGCKTLLECRVYQTPLESSNLGVCVEANITNDTLMLNFYIGAGYYGESFFPTLKIPLNTEKKISVREVPIEVYEKVGLYKESIRYFTPHEIDSIVFGVNNKEDIVIIKDY